MCRLTLHNANVASCRTRIGTLAKTSARGRVFFEFEGHELNVEKGYMCGVIIRTCRTNCKSLTFYYFILCYGIKTIVKKILVSFFLFFIIRQRGGRGKSGTFPNNTLHCIFVENKSIAF